MTFPESKPATKGTRGKTVGITLAVLVVLGAGAFAIVRGGFFASEPPRPADPFEGTPAADFVSGEEALVLPAPTQLPGFTVEQVGAALQTVKSALLAGRLDTAMLYDHSRTAFDALFSDYGVDLLDQLEETNTFTIVATRIAQGYTLADDPVRFKGDITFDGKTLENGIRVLVVHTSFVWVYPFSGQLQRAGDHLVTLRDSVDWMFPEEAEVDPGVAEADAIFDPTSDWAIPDELACTA